MNKMKEDKNRFQAKNWLGQNGHYRNKSSSGCELRKRSGKGSQATYNREEELPGFGSWLSVRSKTKQNITM